MFPIPECNFSPHDVPYGSGLRGPIEDAHDDPDAQGLPELDEPIDQPVELVHVDQPEEREVEGEPQRSVRLPRGVLPERSAAEQDNRSEYEMPDGVIGPGAGELLPADRGSVDLADEDKAHLPDVGVSVEESSTALTNVDSPGEGGTAIGDPASLQTDVAGAGVAANYEGGQTASRDASHVPTLMLEDAALLEPLGLSKVIGGGSTPPGSEDSEAQSERPDAEAGADSGQQPESVDIEVPQEDAQPVDIKEAIGEALGTIGAEPEPDILDRTGNFYDQAPFREIIAAASTNGTSVDLIRRCVSEAVVQLELANHDDDLLGKERFADLGSDAVIAKRLQDAGVLPRTNRDAIAAVSETLRALDGFAFLPAYISTQRGHTFNNIGQPIVQPRGHRSAEVEEDFGAVSTYRKYGTDRLRREDIALQRSIVEVARELTRLRSESPTVQSRNPSGVFLVLTQAAAVLQQREKRSKQGEGQ